MLRIEHLSKSFGGVRAVDGCSFSVASRAITALIGPNGAGKTTVFECVSGFLSPDAGRVTLDGRDLTGLPPWTRARAGISRTFQQVRLWPYLTMEEHLLLPQDASDDRMTAVSGGDGAPRRAAARAALERVGLPHDLLGRLGSDCSYGQSKLLELARALLWLRTARSSPIPSPPTLGPGQADAPIGTGRSPSRRDGEKKAFPHHTSVEALPLPTSSPPPPNRGGAGGGTRADAWGATHPANPHRVLPNPRVKEERSGRGGGAPGGGILLLDEPVAGVHPVLRLDIAEILKRLRADGETILVIEHDMDFVRAVADRVIVMAEGRVLLEGTPEEVLRHPDVMEAYLGVGV